MSTLTKAEIERLFQHLNTELAAMKLSGELYLVGGAAMCLAFSARKSTRDVDALFKPSKAIREAAARVARKHGVQPNWLNDGVKAFLSPHAEFSTYLELSHLRVSCANADYMLAMKCLAMRIGEEFQDLNDVRYLLTYLGIDNYKDAVKQIAKYYPLDQFPQKTLYALEEILAEGTL